MNENGKNTLYCEDNLNRLRKMPNNIVDLVYLDPPFQSGRNYNMCFEVDAKKRNGKATAQVTAFSDIWTWDESDETKYDEFVSTETNPKLVTLMRSFMAYLGGCPLMSYLVFMAPRLSELRRVMKDTASIYLHCDPTASHYLKLLMDAVFGAKNFRNEIVWHYPSMSATKRDFPRKHDIILRYSKTDTYVFNADAVRIPYLESSKKIMASGAGGNLANIGKRTKSKSIRKAYGNPNGKIVDTVWEIPHLSSQKERLGYPTQKPEALLERIIKASSNEGDLVLDPFCGCGTTVAVAQRLNRRWIGIDITILSIMAIKQRFDMAGYTAGKDFKIEGYPTDEYAEEVMEKSDPEGYKKYLAFKTRIIPSTPKKNSNADDLLSILKTK